MATYPNFRNANYKLINEIIVNTLRNWINNNDQYNDNISLQELYDKFISFLTSVIQQHIPHKTKHNTKRNKRPRNIHKLLKEKRILYKKLKTDKSFKTQYKAKSKQYDLAVQRWHDKKEEGICKNPSSKKFYSFFKKRMNIKHSIPPLFDDHGKIFTSDEDKAHLLNSSFLKLFTDDDGFPLFLPSKTN